MEAKGKLVNLNDFGYPDSSEIIGGKKMAKPIKKWNTGLIEVAQWLNETKDKKQFYTYTIRSSYKDGEAFKESKSFTRDDLLKLDFLINSALLDTITVK